MEFAPLWLHSGRLVCPTSASSAHASHKVPADSLCPPSACSLPCRGDNNGPFDAQTIQERREELRQEREERKRAAASRARRSSGGKTSAAAYDDGEDLDAQFDDDEDDY